MSGNLPDSPRVEPCVGSGRCCKKVPCGYGDWNESKTQCRYLEEAYVAVDPQDGQSTRIYRCGRYAFISQQPGADFMPAFGAGCCMNLFNDNRERVIRLLVQGDEGAFEVLRPNLAGYPGPK
jgi:hypothetical protein